LRRVGDRLFLVAVSVIPEFRPIVDALSRLDVYNLNPREIAAMQSLIPVTFFGATAAMSARAAKLRSRSAYKSRNA
jgi:hypothetical protein